jgi:hypothetical protein
MSGLEPDAETDSEEYGYGALTPESLTDAVAEPEDAGLMTFDVTDDYSGMSDLSTIDPSDLGTDSDFDFNDDGVVDHFDAQALLDDLDFFD